MVVANGIAEKEPVRFSIDLRDLCGEGFGTAIGELGLIGVDSS